MIDLLSLLLALLALQTPLYAQKKHELDMLSTISLPANSMLKNAAKDWTLIVYIAADNDLRGFAGNNIRQMATIGSTDFINVLVHLDIRITPNNKTTRRYYVDKGRVIHLNADDPSTACLDSGDPQTLISACQWALKDFPAKNYALVLWNHGTGALNPETNKVVHPNRLFNFNPHTNKLELDRSIGFFDFLQSNKSRGICWDDTTGNYLNDDKLDYALNYVTQNYMSGGKFDILAFDACLMSMIEITNLIKPYAKIMVTSQEVVLGTGWPYDLMLAPFENGSMDAQTWATHMVEAYRQKFMNITSDFTLSAIYLDRTIPLEENINQVGALLCTCMSAQADNSVKNGIAVARNKKMVTHFHEPSYVDLHHIYTNLYTCAKDFQFTSPEDEHLRSDVLSALEQGTKLIRSCIFANCTGKNLRTAHGISIYFPDYRMHSSYAKSNFAQTNDWLKFIINYLAA